MIALGIVSLGYLVWGLYICCANLDSRQFLDNEQNTTSYIITGPLQEEDEDVTIEKGPTPESSDSEEESSEVPYSYDMQSNIQSLGGIIDNYTNKV